MQNYLNYNSSNNDAHSLMMFGDNQTQHNEQQRFHQTSIESICHDVFHSVNRIIQNRVANKDLTFLTENEYSMGSRHLQYKFVKAYLAKRWLVFFVAIILIIKDLFSDNSHLLISLAVSAALCIGLEIFESCFGNISLSSVGDRLFLSTIEKNLYDRHMLLEKTNKEYYSINANITYHTQHTPNKIQELVYDDQICLLGLKNNIFDCVGSSSLTALTLIEQKIPAPIMRIRSKDDETFEHATTIVNLLIDVEKNKKLPDIHTWNTDAIIIDSWYDLCISVRDVLKDKDFFKNFPFLKMENKICREVIQGDDPSPYYQFAVKKLIEYRSKYQDNSNNNHVNLTRVSIV